MQALINYIPQLDLSCGLSVYIHIPFCRHKCYFCDFFSVQGWSEYQRNRIIDQILEHVHRYLQHLNISKIETFYLGGGTPSLLTTKQLQHFLDIAAQFHAHEITAEANPESLEREWTQTLFSYPQARLSLGLQSFITDELKKLGRIISSQELENSLQFLSDFHQRINLDFLAGIRSQDENVLMYELRRLVDFQPAHISFYMLTLEEGTPLFHRPHLVPPEETRSELWLLGKDFLHRYGYIDYEISNFTQYCPSRHNQRYWQLHPYVGFGPGAVSNLPLNNGQALRLQGIHKLSAWGDLDNQQNLYAAEVISSEDFLFEHFMMGLRTRRGVDTEVLHHRFGEKAKAILQEAEQLTPIKRNGIYRYLDDNARLRLNRHLIQIMEILDKQQIQPKN